MQIQLRRRLALIGRLLPAQYILPIALLLALSFGCLFGLLIHLTSVQDRMERRREVELVNQSIASAISLSDHDLRDYAVWDEAVFRLVRRFDRQWANDNLGPYLGGEQGYDYVFVLDGADRPVYQYSAGVQDRAFDAKAVLGTAFSLALDKVREGPEGGDPLIAGYSRSGGSIYIFSVSAIVPLTDRASLPSGRKHAIGIARKLDLDFYRRALDGMHDLRLAFEQTVDDGRASAVLRSPSGAALATLHWSPATPGSTLRSQIFPAFLAIGFICLFVAGIIVSRGRKSLEALRFSESRAHHMARHDLLTGLPNRRAMKLALDSHFSNNTPVCLLYMDLDGFKETNDVYGHGAGDGLLKAVALRLSDYVPAPHILGRVGGDEFAVIMAADAAAAIEVAESILTAFSTAFSIGEYHVSLGVSIGIAATEPMVDTDELVRRADSAMYAAKASGKHCLQLYSPALDAGRERRKQLETDLRTAIRDGGIRIVYQSLVCARTRAIVGVEALARWQHPLFGPIPPDQFIPIAESSGLIIELGRGILAAACREARDWSVDLAVNLSPAQFWDRGLASAIAGVLEETSFPPERLELEITEGYLMRRPEAAARILKQLKAIGVRISLDDFGTGFASIGYLQQLNFDGIKIDRSFVATSGSDPKSADLARAIIAIGDALDVPVTAEGVESIVHANLMQAAGCSRLQGWLFGKPMPAEEMGAWLADRSRLAG